MKKITPVLLALSAVSSMSFAATSNDTVNYLQLRNGLTYQVNHEKPYTGQYQDNYSNGQIAVKARFNKGQEVGLETKWFANGQVASKTHFDHGKLSGQEITWFENGQKAEVATFKQGQLDGVANKWFENGQKQAHEHFVNGKLDGKVSYWYPNGKLRKQATYQKGSPTGDMTEYYSNGHKAVQTHFSSAKEGNYSVTKFDPQGHKVQALTFKKGDLNSEQTWLSAHS